MNDKFSSGSPSYLFLFQVIGMCLSELCEFPLSPTELTPLSAICASSSIDLSFQDKGTQSQLLR